MLLWQDTDVHSNYPHLLIDAILKSPDGNLLGTGILSCKYHL